MGDLMEPMHFVVIGFIFCILLLVPAIFYLLTLQNTLTKCPPGSRTMEPGMVWLSLIPIFSLIWSFFVVMALGRSLGNEYRRRGIPCLDPLPGQSIGMAMCICGCCAVIPFFNFLAGPAALVLWVIYWVKIAEFSRVLDMPVGMYQPPPVGMYQPPPVV